ncbi:thiamine ABC transporter substrate-binding protein [Leucobacter sp. GX24907]
MTLARSLTVSIAATAVLGLALTSCASGSSEGTSGDGDEKVTLVVHDSFPNEEFAAAASAATGYDVEVVSAGDGGELSSQLVLTEGAPIADAFFGIDNVFASRIADGVSTPYVPDTLPEGAEELLYDEEGSLTPVTQGATCINIDPAWFEDHDLPEPTSYDDLTDEQYRGLTVLLDPASSSTGASFLVGTVAKFGEDGFADYWADLAANDARIEQGWTEAYNGQFTQGGEGGESPIVLSYSSSPAWTVTEDGSETTTKALLDTCSSQIEYAGVLAGAANPEGAQAVVDYLVSREFQDTIADSMYVYPVDDGAYLPEEWEEFAPLPSEPNDLPAPEIGAGRDGWLKTWSEATGW